MLKPGVIFITLSLLGILSVVVVRLLAESTNETDQRQTGEPLPAKPLILTDEQSEYPLGLHMEILQDPGGELTIEDVSSEKFDPQFVANNKAAPNYGFTKNAIWVRFTVDNQTRRTVEWPLELNFPNTHYVDIYFPSPDGQGFEVKQSGNLRPISTRDILHPQIVFDLSIPIQGRQTYYLRFQSEASMTLGLTLWTKKQFLIDAQYQNWLAGLFFGILIGLLAYHLFLLFSLRDKNYLFFVFELAATIFLVLGYDGYLWIYFLPSLYYLADKLLPLSFSLLFVSMILFADSFLEIKTQFSQLHRANLFVLSIWGMLLLLIPFASYHLLALLIMPWALVSMGLSLAVGITSFIRGYRPARLYLVAWSGLLVTLSIVVLVRMGLVFVTSFTENLFRFGMVWLGVCWSMALSDRIHILQLETESANRKLRMNEGRLSQILEGLPLGVVYYGKDHKPRYINKRAVELISDPERDVQPSPSNPRTLAEALHYFSIRVAGSSQDYPLEDFPIFKALGGTPASADDIEIVREDKQIPLEVWASPIVDDAGNVESAVASIQDITQRKSAEAELFEYQRHLEALVAKKTKELSAVNEQLSLRLEWLSAVNRVNQTMARQVDHTDTYEKILEIIGRLFLVPGSFIGEMDENSKQVKILAYSSQKENHPNLVGSFLTLPDELSSGSIQGRASLISLSRDQLSFRNELMDQHIQAAKVQGMALIPLRHREQFFGFLGFEMEDQGKNFTSEESNLLSIFSVDIAQLIENDRLFNQVKELITAEERNRLARDLHDSVTQMLYSANLLADVLPQIWRRDPERGLQKLSTLRQLTRGALAEMRTMLLELRPSAVISTPLGDLLAQLTEAIASRSGLQFQLFVEKLPSLPEEAQVTFYRVAQEALNNVVKHAQAKNVSVSLSANFSPGNLAGGAMKEVRLKIEDDGVGFASGKMPSTRLGIGIMHERAAAIQANLSLESQPGHGTRVTLFWCYEVDEQ